MSGESTDHSPRVAHHEKKHGVPTEVQVLPFGRHETERGVFVLDEAGMEAAIRDFEGRTNDMVVDYEHQTLSGGEAPAAGWIKRLIAKGPDGGDLKSQISNLKSQAGLWAVVEWTERAKEYLRNREYRYLSPVFLKDPATELVVRLINCALTNQPAIDGMVPVVNTLKAGDIVFPQPRLIIEPVKEERMEKLMEALGLKPEASEAEAVGVVMALKAGSEQAAVYGAELMTLRGDLALKDAKGLVEVAMKEGKLLPSQKDWAEDYAFRSPEGFTAFIAKAPVQVPMGVLPNVETRRAALLDALTLSVNRALGITEDVHRRYN